MQPRERRGREGTSDGGRRDPDPRHHERSCRRGGERLIPQRKGSTQHHPRGESAALGEGEQQQTSAPGEQHRPHDGGAHGDGSDPAALLSQRLPNDQRQPAGRDQGHDRVVIRVAESRELRVQRQKGQDAGGERADSRTPEPPPREEDGQQRQGAQQRR